MIKAIAVVYLQQEIAGPQTGHISHAAGINMIQILQTRTAIRWLQLHQRRGGLGAAQNESEAALGSMQHNRARIGYGSARATGKKYNRF